MKKPLKITLKVVVSLLTLLVVIYFLGPTPPKPHFTKLNFEKAVSLAALEQSIVDSEKREPNIKQGNEATIVWADSSKKAKTKVAFLYLHGFGASHHEGYPVNLNVAKQFNSNLFLARLSEHGVEKGDSNLLYFTAEDYALSGERALHIAKQLGDSVVILATSGGASMALFLAARHPEIKGLITYSPAIRIFKRESALLSGPWGLQIARLVLGKDHNDWNFKNPKQKYFWTNHQRIEGVVQFSLFLKYTMTKATFQQVHCPFFMGYYYENEEKQDNTVSVIAMKEMYEQLSTPPQYKREKAFPKADSHVITSDLTTDTWQAVEAESVKFIKEILGM